MEKRIFLGLLREKNQIFEETKIDRFKPNRAQKPFLESKAKIRAFIAANKIGKTTIGVKDLWEHVKVGGKVARVISGLGFEKGVRDVIIPEILKWFPPSRILSKKPNSQGVIVKMEILGDNGQNSIITFMSSEQDDIVFEGDVSDYVWIDEPVRQTIYVAALRGIMVTNGRMILTFTPLKEPWAYNEIFLSKDPEIECFQGSLYDAMVENGGHLTRKQIESFVSKIPEDERPARVYGQFRHLIGRVYKAFRTDVHVVEPFRIPADWPVYVCIDPHARKPHAALFMAVSPQEEWFVCNEIFFAAGIEEFGAEVLSLCKHYNVVTVLIDTSSETKDWNRQETGRSILAKIGLQTKLARKKNLKEPARFIIQQALEGKDGTGAPWLFVFRTCPRTIFEFQNHIWDDHRSPEMQGIKETPKKINDDMLNDLEYIVVEKPRYAKPRILDYVR